jgi:hypothetical protein
MTLYTYNGIGRRGLTEKRSCPFMLQVKVKVKLSHYKPGWALGVLGG